MFNIYLKKLFSPVFPMFLLPTVPTFTRFEVPPPGAPQCIQEVMSIVRDVTSTLLSKPTGAHVALNGASAEAVGFGRMQWK